MYAERLMLKNGKNTKAKEALSVRQEEESWCILYVDRPLNQKETETLLLTGGLPWFDTNSESDEDEATC